MIDFSEEQLERYSRHILLADVGVEGQEKIFAAKVLVVGAGGLGCPVGLYLAAAGVGRVGIIDSDRVEVSNLQRQIGHFSKDVGVSKVRSLGEKMRAINPQVELDLYEEHIVADNAMELIKGYDFVIDGTDNFPTKFLVNDACVMAGIPLSHGGILRFDGQTTTIVPGDSSCLRCSFRKPPPPNAVPSCSQAGILGAVAGMLGTIQATEALKYITGAGSLLTDTLLSFNAKSMAFRKINIRRDKQCPLCGNSPTITELEDAPQAVCDLTANRVVRD